LRKHASEVVVGPAVRVENIPMERILRIEVSEQFDTIIRGCEACEKFVSLCPSHDEAEIGPLNVRLPDQS